MCTLCTLYRKSVKNLDIELIPNRGILEMQIARGGVNARIASEKFLINSDYMGIVYVLQTGIKEPK